MQSGFVEENKAFNIIGVVYTQNMGECKMSFFAYRFIMLGADDSLI